MIVLFPQSRTSRRPDKRKRGFFVGAVLVLVVTVVDIGLGRRSQRARRRRTIPDPRPSNALTAGDHQSGRNPSQIYEEVRWKKVDREEAWWTGTGTGVYQIRDQRSDNNHK